ncbi:3'-5' exonuclease [Zavarzinella formosa]|uniref:3'-5' exonuclease n=1 Tax=Zavarzinella formosa TaxID=360055 RepID=UPI0009079BA5
MFHNLRLARPLAFLDIESTGANPQTDRIIEIAVLRIDPDGRTAEACRRVNPGVSILAAATAVHGITEADAPVFTAVVPRLVRFLDGCDLAGFGIKRFGLPMLAAECRRAGVHFPLAGRAIVDALQIYHQRERRDLTNTVLHRRRTRRRPLGRGRCPGGGFGAGRPVTAVARPSVLCRRPPQTPHRCRPGRLVPGRRWPTGVRPGKACRPAVARGGRTASRPHKVAAVARIARRHSATDPGQLPDGIRKRLTFQSCRRH